MTAGENDTPEEELVRRICSGDEAAFQEYCDRQTAALETYIRRRLPGALRRKVAVSDVLQDAYLVALRRLGEFEDQGEGSLTRWLSRIIDLKVKDMVKRYVLAAKRHVGREVPADLGSERAPPALAGNPAEDAMAAEVRDAVDRTMARLSEDYRLILRLVQWEGLTLAEAARFMGRSREAAKKLYGRALARFSVLFLSEQKDRRER